MASSTAVVQGNTPLPYTGMSSMDAAVQNAIAQFQNSAGQGTVQLPDLSRYLTATYKPYAFKQPAYESTDYNPFAYSMPDYSPEQYQETQFTTPDMTAANDIQSVADIPKNILDAIYENSRQRVGRTADTQRHQAQNQFGTMGAGGRNLMLAAIRDINRGQFEQEGQLATQAMTDDANRNYEEAKTVRGLRLGREETLANMALARQQAQAQENQVGYKFGDDAARYQAGLAQWLQSQQAGEADKSFQYGRDENRYQTGLADTLQTRLAAEQEKAYQANYARQQDIVNTKMNQAQFQSAERANEASRQQASIQQALNYMNQAGNYRLNAAQLQQKANDDKSGFDWSTLAGGAGTAAGSAGGTYLTSNYKPLGYS